MKKFILVIIFLLSASATADNVARQSQPSSFMSQPSSGGTRLNCELTMGAEGCLDGNLPSFTNVDRNFALHPPTHNEACIPKWNKFKQKAAKVVPQHISVPLSKLEQSAESVGLNLDALHHAVGTFLKNQTQIPQQNYISVVDYDKNSNQPRWFFFSLRDGSVKSFKVSNGKGSDPNFDGKADQFSNDWDTNASSLGCSVTGDTYDGKHPNSIRMFGLEDTNYGNCDRSIVVHAAGYAPSGRSWGCLAVPSTGDSVSGKKGSRVKEEGIASMLGQGAIVCNYKSKDTYQMFSKGDRRSSVQAQNSGKHHYKSKRRKYSRRRKNVQQYYPQYSYNTYY